MISLLELALIFEPRDPMSTATSNSAIIIYKSYNINVFMMNNVNDKGKISPDVAKGVLYLTKTEKKSIIAKFPKEWEIWQCCSQ